MSKSGNKHPLYSFHVPSELLELTKEKAKLEGVSVSETINDALWFYLLNHCDLK